MVELKSKWIKCLVFGWWDYVGGACSKSPTHIATQHHPIDMTSILSQNLDLDHLSRIIYTQLHVADEKDFRPLDIYGWPLLSTSVHHWKVPSATTNQIISTAGGLVICGVRNWFFPTFKRHQKDYTLMTHKIPGSNVKKQQKTTNTSRDSDLCHLPIWSWVYHLHPNVHDLLTMGFPIVNDANLKMSIL